MSRHPDRSVSRAYDSLPAMPGTIDLHSHSTASDGLLSPAELVRRAHAQGVEVLALTDHDTVAGLDEAARAASSLGLRLVPGIELSTQALERSLHVTGLGLDPASPRLAQLIRALDALREARAEKMGRKLARCGVSGAYEGARRLAGVALPTRTHFARYLLEQGAVRDMDEAFRRYLGRGKPGYVRAEWPPLAQVVEVIRASGGIAVLAHPHAYGWTGAWTRRIIEAFVAAGGRGLEVVCGNSTRDSILVMGGHARRFGLLASVGSDFHQPGWVELGRLAPLPTGLEPVWRELPGVPDALAAAKRP